MARYVGRRQSSFARGLNDSAAPEEYARNEVSEMLDARLSLAGNGATRRGGSKRTHSTALNTGATVYGLREFNPTGASVQLCAFVGDRFYTSTDGGANWTEQATGLPTAYWSMVVTDACGSRVLYAANGGSVYQWDGTTWSTLTNAPSGVKYLSVFGGRLYAAGHDGETVQASKVQDFGVWDTTKGALSVKVSTHDGDAEIRGLYQLGEAVLVFKRESTAYIAGYGQETLTVETGPEGGVSRSVGCRGFRTIRATAEDAVVWLSERGFELYRLGGQIRLLGRPTQGFLDGLNHDHIKDNPGLPVAVYWPRKNEYWCAVPHGNSTENDRIWVYRPPGADTTPARWLYRPSYPVTTLAVADRSGAGRMPYGGGGDGFVRALEDGENGDRNSDDSGGSTVTARLTSMPFTWGDQNLRKRSRVVRGSVQAPAQASVTYIPVADGADQGSHSISHPASSGPQSKKARVNARGYVVKVKAEWSDPDLTLQGLQVSAKRLRKGW